MTDDEFGLVLAHVSLEGLAVDLGLRDGRVVEVCGSLVALPGLVDGHIHLDKTFPNLRWVSHRPDGSVAVRIAAERAQLRAIAEPMAIRA